MEESFDKMPVQGLSVEANGHKVNLAGVAQCSDICKMYPMAGNMEGAEAANGNQLVTVEQISEESTRDTPEPTFYTIKNRGHQKCRSNLLKTGNSHP